MDSMGLGRRDCLVKQRQVGTGPSHSLSELSRGRWGRRPWLLLCTLTWLPLRAAQVGRGCILSYCPK